MAANTIRDSKNMPQMALATIYHHFEARTFSKTFWGMSVSAGSPPRHFQTESVIPKMSAHVLQRESDILTSTHHYPSLRRRICFAITQGI